MAGFLPLEGFVRATRGRARYLLLLVTACTTDQLTGPTARRLLPSLAPTMRPCGTARQFFAGTALADREDWYGKQLGAMDEQPLCTDSAHDRESYRFTWIPSFHPAVTVRVDLTATGYRLTGKILNGAGGYAPGSVAREIARPFSDAEFAHLSALLTSVRFWALPAHVRNFGCDGAQWILEALTPQGYHVVDRWSPGRDGPGSRFRALGEWMLARSGLVAPSLVSEY